MCGWVRREVRRGVLCVGGCFSWGGVELFGWSRLKGGGKRKKEYKFVAKEGTRDL